MLSENYKKYFKMMMDKHGIKSLDQLSSEEKKIFFNAVDKNYKAKRNSSVEINQNDYDDLYLLIHHILKQQYSESDLNK